MAVAAVVAVVVVGMVTLNRVQQALFTPTDSVTSPGHQPARPGVTGTATPGLGQSGVNPSLPPAGRKAKSPLISPLPQPTCIATPTPSGTPTPTASASGSPTPTPSNTATATPSATPSGTSSPSATPFTGTASGTAGTASGTAGTTTDAKYTAGIGDGTPNISCDSTPTPKTTS